MVFIKIIGIIVSAGTRNVAVGATGGAGAVGGLGGVGAAFLVFAAGGGSAGSVAGVAGAGARIVAAGASIKSKRAIDRIVHLSEVISGFTRVG
jgi:hypothetical protein